MVEEECVDGYEEEGAGEASEEDAEEGDGEAAGHRVCEDTDCSGDRADAKDATAPPSIDSSSGEEPAEEPADRHEAAVEGRDRA